MTILLPPCSASSTPRIDETGPQRRTPSFLFVPWRLFSPASATSEANLSGPGFSRSTHATYCSTAVVQAAVPRAAPALSADAWCGGCSAAVPPRSAGSSNAKASPVSNRSRSPAMRLFTSLQRRRTSLSLETISTDATSGRAPHHSQSRAMRSSARKCAPAKLVAAREPNTYARTPPLGGGCLWRRSSTWMTSTVSRCCASSAYVRRRRSRNGFAEGQPRLARTLSWSMSTMWSAAALSDGPDGSSGGEGDWARGGWTRSDCIIFARGRPHTRTHK